MAGLSTGDVVLAIGPTLLWRTDWSSAEYQSPAEGASVLKSLTYTILGFLGEGVEDVEPSAEPSASAGVASS